MSSTSLNQTTLPSRSPSSATPPSASSSDTILSNGPLDASRDARQIVRLVQCSQCSLPLREPVTFPCGNSVCKKCIPPTHFRPNISYIAAPDRLQGFTCPFLDCGKEHVLADCSGDVVLNKITDLVRAEMQHFRTMPEASEVLLQVEEKDKWSVAGVSSMKEEEVRRRVLQGGRLAATYTMAEMGELAHNSEVIYTLMSPASEISAILDTAFLDNLKDVTRSELDCQVCYALFLDPLTTRCGHTFCRKCIHRNLDHSNLCPMCRRLLTYTPMINAQAAPSNILLTKLLTGLCPEALAARAEVDKADEFRDPGGLDTPLFVCTLSFPSMPTFLHIFEPRYRLMIRRAMESGDRKFGMLLSNPENGPDGNISPNSPHQYGTLLQVVNMHLIADGRSIIESKGISRFRVLRTGYRDGYLVGKVERVGDISLADEEALEASETTHPPAPSPTSPLHRTSSIQEPLSPAQHPTSNHRRHNSSSPPVDYSLLPTQELMNICTIFVARMRAQSKSWLQTRVIQAYGECPADLALFPWWFATVLPIGDAEKYRLLATTSVRERLKICAEWVASIESQSWFKYWLWQVGEAVIAPEFQPVYHFVTSRY